MRFFLIASLLLHLSLLYYFYTSERISLSERSEVEVAMIERIELPADSPTDLENDSILPSQYEKVQKSTFPKVKIAPQPAAKPAQQAAAVSAAPQSVKAPPAPKAAIQSISSTQLGLKIKYPRLSRMLSEQGKVIVLVHTNERGHVKKMSVTGSSGFARLDEAALEAVSNSREVNYDKNSQIKISFLFKLK